MELRNFIATTIREYLNEQMSNDMVRLYHKVGKGIDFGVVKNVIQNGLIPYNNGEMGSVIWFSDNYNDYAEGNDFVLYYDLKISENGITNNKYGILYDGQNAYAHKQIPFNMLGVNKIPVGKSEYGNFITNEDFLVNGIFFFLLENTQNATIYVDLFNKFVEPYLKEKNTIKKYQLNNNLKLLFNK